MTILTQNTEGVLFENNTTFKSLIPLMIICKYDV